MSKYTVLFTACCGWPTCGTINALKSSKSNNFRVIGCDCNPDNAAKNYVDALYRVPKCTDRRYIEMLLEICEHECVDVLVPLISDEINVIFDSLELFEKSGVAVLLSGRDSNLKIANDKYDLMLFLKENNIDVMPESIVLDKENVWGALRKFGYPEKAVCVKPSSGCGSAGFRIVDDKKAASNVLSSSRSSRSNLYITAKQLADSIKTCVDRFIMQPFYPGNELSTICLVDHGRTVYSPSHFNFDMQNATATRCELVDNKCATEIVTKINKLMGFDGNIGYDFRFDENSNLKLTDVNPRISATVSLAAKAGLNLVEMGVLHALGVSIDESIVPNYGMRLTRNYGTLYCHADGTCYGF